MVVREVYNFGDGRVGTKTYSDKFFRTIEEENENGEKVLVSKNYKIRKAGTSEVYEEAIDILNFDYEELTEAEMEAEYGSNQ